MFIDRWMDEENAVFWLVYYKLRTAHKYIILVGKFIYNIEVSDSKVIYVYSKFEQISKYIVDNVNCSSLWEKEVTHEEREKARMNTVVINWNWRYLYEFLSFNIHEIWVSTEARLYVCSKYTYFLSLSVMKA